MNLNTFVIKLRNDPVLETYQGGLISFLPLIDELITLPISEQILVFDIFNIFKVGIGSNLPIFYPILDDRLVVRN